ncbi:MAG TPA: hypothetical protein VFM55_16065 [Micromonosporaceae bacterium]|nr:hypothetical protein [Micromonosporaceae bacterium]
MSVVNDPRDEREFAYQPAQPVPGEELPGPGETSDPEDAEHRADLADPDLADRELADRELADGEFTDRELTDREDADREDADRPTDLAEAADPTGAGDAAERPYVDDLDAGELDRSDLADAARPASGLTEPEAADLDVTPHDRGDGPAALDRPGDDAEEDRRDAFHDAAAAGADGEPADADRDRDAYPVAASAGPSEAGPSHAVGVAPVPDTEYADDRDLAGAVPEETAAGAGATPVPDTDWERDVVPAPEAEADREPDVVPAPEAEADREPEALPAPEAPAAEAPTPEAPAAEGAELMPGAVTAPSLGALWDDDRMQDLRDRWREVQLRFVDDPRSAADQARALLDDTVEELTGALRSHREELASWGSGAGDDTERLRVAVRQYRELLDRLLAW